jgi:hypothetical protein
MVHYGKDIKTFSPRERELIIIDSILCSIFEEIRTNPEKMDKFIINLTSKLIENRTTLVLKILEVEEMEEVSTPEEILSVVESSEYSFMNYLQEKKEMEESVKWN